MNPDSISSAFPSTRAEVIGSLRRESGEVAFLIQQRSSLAARSIKYLMVQYYYLILSSGTLARVVESKWSEVA
jgi:hypothetical protein